MLYCEIEPYLQKSVIALAAILRPGGPANVFAGDKRMVGFWRKPSNSIVAVMSANAGDLDSRMMNSFKSPPQAIKSEIQSATSCSKAGAGSHRGRARRRAWFGRAGWP